MSIAWGSAMTVGDESIDADHRHLVALINDFEAAVAGPVEHQRAATVLLALAEHTADHFRREEELQFQARYPYYESHRRTHRDVLARLTALTEDYARSGGMARDEMIGSVAGFLKDCLAEHILQSDLRMKPYVQAWKRQMTAAESRRRAAGAAPATTAAIIAK